jgi:hypothetical protein
MYLLAEGEELGSNLLRVAQSSLGIQADWVPLEKEGRRAQTPRQAGDGRTGPTACGALHPANRVDPMSARQLTKQANDETRLFGAHGVVLRRSHQLPALTRNAGAVMMRATCTGSVTHATHARPLKRMVASVTPALPGNF